jgi:hypothetical protein
MQVPGVIVCQACFTDTPATPLVDAGKEALLWLRARAREVMAPATKVKPDA